MIISYKTSFFSPPPHLTGSVESSSGQKLEPVPALVVTQGSGAVAAICNLFSVFLGHLYNVLDGSLFSYSIFVKAFHHNMCHNMTACQQLSAVINIRSHGALMLSSKLSTFSVNQIKCLWTFAKQKTIVSKLSKLGPIDNCQQWSTGSALVGGTSRLTTLPAALRGKGSHSSTTQPPRVLVFV